VTRTSLLIVSIMCTGIRNGGVLGPANRAGNCLTNPPGGVRRELVTPLILEFIDGLHQTDVFLPGLDRGTGDRGFVYFLANETTSRRFALNQFRVLPLGL